MKTIKELEKEIEEFNKKYPDGFYGPASENELFNIVNGKLQNLKEVLEMIDKDFMYLRKDGQRVEAVLEKLKSKIEGK